jgi:hypothetical protein
VEYLLQKKIHLGLKKIMNGDLKRITRNVDFVGTTKGKENERQKAEPIKWHSVLKKIPMDLPKPKQ